MLPFWIYFVIFIVIYFTDSPFSNESNVTFQSLFGLLLLFFVGAIADEVGYMGYAIEPMQTRFWALFASILIGIPWVIWHYPSISQQGYNAVWVVWGTLVMIAVRVFIVWIFNNTGKVYSLAFCFIRWWILEEYCTQKMKSTPL